MVCAVQAGFREKFGQDQNWTGKDLNRSVADWLGSRSPDNFFMFINYFDVHGPYRHEPPYDSIFSGDRWAGPPLHFLRLRPDTAPAGGLPEYQILKGVVEDGFLLDYETDMRYYLAQYDAGIRKADEALEELTRILKGLGVYEDTLLILSADHGEAFGENNLYCCHGLALTPDQIRVPLIMKPHRGWPGPHPERVGTQVSLVDLMPTILDLTGLEYDPAELDGRSLVPLLAGRESDLAGRALEAATISQTCRIDDEKMIIRTRPPRETAEIEARLGRHWPTGRRDAASRVRRRAAGRVGKRSSVSGLGAGGCRDPRHRRSARP